MATGFGCKEVYRFPHTLLVSVLFLQQHPYFLFIFLMFFVFVPVLFGNYILCI